MLHVPLFTVESKINCYDQGCQNRVLTRKIVRFYESKHALRVKSFKKIKNG